MNGFPFTLSIRKKYSYLLRVPQVNKLNLIPYVLIYFGMKGFLSTFGLFLTIKGHLSFTNLVDLDLEGSDDFLVAEDTC